MSEPTTEAGRRLLDDFAAFYQMGSPGKTAIAAAIDAIEAAAQDQYAAQYAKGEAFIRKDERRILLAELAREVEGLPCGCEELVALGSDGNFHRVHDFDCTIAVVLALLEDKP